MQTRTPIALKFGTQKGSPKANPSITFGANPMNGSKVFGIHLLINGPNLQLFVPMNWDGPHSKHVVTIYLFGLCIPSSIREQPLISLNIFNLTHYLLDLIKPCVFYDQRI